MASNNSTASTLLDPLGRNKVQIGFEVFFAVIICLVSMLGNILLVFVINKDPQLKNITNVFIHNLAWTDICMAALAMPFWIISLYNGRWIFSTELCKWDATVTVTSGSCALYTIGIIAVNRYLKVVKSSIYPKVFPSIRMARVYCVCVWLLVVLSSTAPLYGWGTFTYHKRAAFCSLTWQIENISYAITFAGVSFCVIFGVILFCYYKVYRKLKVSSSNLTSHAAQNNAQNLPLAADVKLLKTTFTVVCVFFSFWAPGTVVFLCETIFGPLPRFLSATATYLLLGSSAANPVIYGAMNPQFKRAFVKVLKWKNGEEERQENKNVRVRGIERTSAV